MDTLHRRHYAFWETHPPGQRSRLAVIAISGKKAPDSANPVAKRSRWRTGIQKLQQRQFRSPTKQQHGSESTEKSTKPCKSIAAKQQRPGIREEHVRLFQHVIQLRADDPRKSGHGDHEKRVGLHSSPVEIGLQYICRANQR